MKKIIYPLLTAILFSFSNTAMAADWQKVTTEEISGGVTYKKILSYTGGGFSMLHVIESDTKNPAASIEVMTAEKGVSYLETTKKMAERYNAIAGINGDFFNTGSARTNMLGAVYQKGELVSTPSKDIWATLAVTETGDILMDYFGFTGTVTSSGGVAHEIYHINKVGSTGGALNMFTPKWGETLTLEEGMHALLIKDGIVTGRITTPGEIPFAGNDTILTANYSVNGYFDNFAAGDEVKLEYSLTGTDAVIKEAVGANTVLVADGKKVHFTHDATGTAQRTAVGINQDGSKLYLVVAEGRQTAYKGFTQSSFADALIELGCYRAVNLDGGGSSTMVTQNTISGNMDIKNKLMSERKVSTSLGLFNRLEYLGDIAGGVCVPGSDTVLSGDSLDIYYKFYDSNSHTVYPERVKVSTTNSADIISGTSVQFNGGGKRTVSVSAEGVTASAEVYVIEAVASAEIYPSSLTIEPGGSANVSVTVWDNEGRKAFANPQNVKWISSGATVNNGRVSYGTGYIGAEFGAAKAYCSVNGGTAPENEYEKNRFMDISREGKHIRISAGSKNYSTIADMLRVLNFEYTLRGADYLYMLNAPLVKDLEYISPDSYSEKTLDNSRIITLNSREGSLRADNQLDKLLGLKNIREKNVIIITEKSPLTLHESEKTLFMESLDAAKNSGKNIFVVYEEVNAQNFTENGICFIGCESHRGSELPSGRTVDFYISGDNISYSL